MPSRPRGCLPCARTPLDYDDDGEEGEETSVDGSRPPSRHGDAPLLPRDATRSEEERADAPAADAEDKAATAPWESAELVAEMDFALQDAEIELAAASAELGITGSAADAAADVEAQDGPAAVAWPHGEALPPAVHTRLGRSAWTLPFVIDVALDLVYVICLFCGPVPWLGGLILLLFAPGLCVAWAAVRSWMIAFYGAAPRFCGEADAEDEDVREGRPHRVVYYLGARLSLWRTPPPEQPAPGGPGGASAGGAPLDKLLVPPHEGWEAVSRMLAAGPLFGVPVLDALMVLERLGRVGTSASPSAGAEGAAGEAAAAHPSPQPSASPHAADSPLHAHAHPSRGAAKREGRAVWARAPGIVRRTLLPLYAPTRLFLHAATHATVQGIVQLAVLGALILPASPRARAPAPAAVAVLSLLSSVAQVVAHVRSVREGARVCRVPINAYLRLLLRPGSGLPLHALRAHSVLQLRYRCAEHELPALGLALAASRGLESLELNGSRCIEPRGAALLARGLLRPEPSASLRHLSLSANPVGPIGAACLASSLERGAPRLRTLALAACALGDTGAGVLARALLRCKHLEALYVHTNSIGDDGAVALAHALRALRSLRHLELSANAIGDRGAAELGSAVASAGSLRELSLGRNRVSNSGAAGLAWGVTHSRSLHALHLFENVIGDAGASAMAGALMRSHALGTLSLSSNNIGNAGVEALRAPLARHGPLRDLRLAGNRIGDDGVLAIADGMLEGKALAALGLSYNRISDEVVPDLVAAVMACPSLLRLDLRGNRLSPESQVQIVRAWGRRAGELLLRAEDTMASFPPTPAPQ